MSSVAKSFTAVGFGAAINIEAKHGATILVTGTFVGTWQLQKSVDGGMSWEVVTTGTGTQVLLKIAPLLTPSSVLYRFRCSAYTSGTMATTVASAVDPDAEQGAVSSTFAEVFTQAFTIVDDTTVISVFVQTSFKPKAIISCSLDKAAGGSFAAQGMDIVEESDAAADLAAGDGCVYISGQGVVVAMPADSISAGDYVVKFRVIY